MVSQNVIPSKQILGGAFPRVFTEHGVLMLSNVLKSKSAIKMSIRIIEMFVLLREMVLLHKDVSMLVEQVEKRLIKQDQKIELLFTYLNKFIENYDKPRTMMRQLLGKRHRPELHGPFLQNPDDLQADMPSVAELREFWNNIHLELEELFASLSAEDWFKRHNAMSDEDFEKDPSRNRLSVLLNRTNHMAYHLGQVKLVRPEVLS